MSRAARVEDAFLDCLAEEPDAVPTPTRINRKLGTSGDLNKLNGRDAALRIRLLKLFGFSKDQSTGRWRKT